MSNFVEKFSVEQEKVRKSEIMKEKHRKTFDKYIEMILDWNEKINLTAITKPDEIILKHFIDSETVLEYIDSKGKLIDIGTGAGFPGIPVKILRPDLKITLVDSLNKRINFLNEVIKELDLKDIEAIHGRAEEMGQDIKYREQYDYVVSRAVARTSILAEFTLPFIKVGGKAIFMKGPSIDEEIEDGRKIIEKLGGKIEKIDKIKLHGSDMDRSIVVIKKESKTPKIYPRKMSVIKKENS